MMRFLHWLGLTLAVVFIVFACIYAGLFYFSVSMPGQAEPELSALTSEQQQTGARLQETVQTLANDIGPRTLSGYARNLDRARIFLKKRLKKQGYTVHEQSFTVHSDTTSNLYVQLPGQLNERVIIGAHYDTHRNTPGADDNASGVAVLLELARRLQGKSFERPISLVFFTNEEKPYHRPPHRGSFRYAHRLKSQAVPVRVMVSLEMLGYYTHKPNSQHYLSVPLSYMLPKTGHFLAFVGKFEQRPLLRDGIRYFRKKRAFPSYGMALPGQIPQLRRSDHGPFWALGYPAFMLTDTANFRNPNYHRQTDTPDTLDYEAMARITDGIEEMVEAFAAQ